MSYLNTVEAFIDDENQLYAANPRRGRDGKLVAEMFLVQNGRTIASDTVAVSDAASREAWAAQISGESSIDASTLTSAIIEHIVPQASAELQLAKSRPSQADDLVTLVKDLMGGENARLKFYRGSDGTAYAKIDVNGHSEMYAVPSLNFRNWLYQESYRVSGKFPKARAVDEAMEAFGAIARYQGTEAEVFLRVAQVDEVIYVDLADAEGHVVEITKDGRRLLTDSPVLFRRPRGMLPLPVPLPGGSLELLRPFMNVPDNDDTMWILLCAGLLGAYRPRGPYPVLANTGEQGTGKSFRTRVLRALIDPNVAPLRTLPRDERDLMITATNNRFLCFDNLSYIAPWQSDAICRLSTGGGYAARKLFTDNDETLLDAQLPIMMNGINDVATKSDLLDRCLLIGTTPIPADRRRPEEEVWAEFEAVRPCILGAIFDAMSTALRNLPSVELPSLPRMAGFAKWVIAAEPSLPWTPGGFLRAYDGSRREAHLMALEASVVAQALQMFAQDSDPEWQGTATDLLKELENYAGNPTRRPRGWPTTPTALSGKLREVLPDLNAVGIFIDFNRSGSSRRITVNFAEWQAAQPQKPSSRSGQTARRSGRYAEGVSGFDLMIGED